MATDGAAQSPQEATTPAITLRDVTKTYGIGKAARQVLGPLSWEVPAGRFVAVMGPSGSGKSTLLHLIGGLVTPSSGDVVLAGRASSGLGDDALAELRRRTVGFVFQAFNLIPMLNVRDNIALPAVIAGTRSSERDRRATELLDVVGLTKVASQLPAELSGGEQQRVALARALMLEPSILLADEPTGSLDSATGADVLALLARVSRQLGKTLVIVTHDASVAAVADEIILLRDGVIANELVLDARSSSETKRREVLDWFDSPVPAARP